MMAELLRRMWVEGRMAEARVRAAIEAAVVRGLLTIEQAAEIFALERRQN